jgi:hypothetical protein
MVAKAKKAAVRSTTKKERRTKRVVEEIDRGLGHAAFAFMQCLLDDLLASGVITQRRVNLVMARARARLIDVPSHRAALNLIEIEQAHREKAMTRSH